MTHHERPRVLAAVLLAAACASACGLPTHAVRVTSERRLPYAGPIAVSMSSPPEHGQALAIVEVSGTGGDVEKLMPAFLKRVAAEGGDFAKIDDIAVRYETETTTRTESYECGTKEAPKTCERTVSDTTEVGTLQIVGRAFSVGRRMP